MKTQIFNRLAACLVVALVAVAADHASGQEITLHEAHPVTGATYVGDSSCAACGDAAVADGSCPNCAGLHGGHGTGGGLFGRGGGGLFGLSGGGDRVVESEIIQRGYGQPDLFYNFYTQGNANQVNAQLYLSPLPVPPNVGHTYYTYQPFMPHHMMYPHVDKYHRYYDGGRGMNRTRASYWTSAHAKAKNVYWNYFRLPR